MPTGRFTVVRRSSQDIGELHWRVTCWFVTDGTPGSGDPYGFGPAPSLGPRIEPSPPPDRSRLVRGLIAGLVAGLILFGTAGWLIGRATPGPPAPTAAPAISTPPALGIYEQSQLALNKPTFPDTLGKISQGWLPYVSGCSRSGTNDGPALNPGEKVRVRCTLGGMSAIFVEYRDVAARDQARVKVLGQNVDARSLAPGAGATIGRPAPSGRTTGKYVEYAYKIIEQGRARTVIGLWWDDAHTPTAAYLLAYWTEGAGESWAPMRDIWTRYA
jgi:hypothetical protein